MLPYVAQGATQAVEDAAVISTSLSRINKIGDISTVLKVYELARKDRAETIQASAVQTRRVLHLSDGEEQQRRDCIMGNPSKQVGNPSLRMNESFQR